MSRKKRKKKSNRKKVVKTAIEKKPQNTFLKRHSDIVACVLILAFVLIFFAPLVFGSYRPGGVDIASTQQTSNLVRNWQETSGNKNIYWMPHLFSGQPDYSQNITVKNLDNWIYYIRFLYPPILYFMLGAFGIFLLSRYLKLSVFASVFASISFVILIHWSSLLEIGHFWKIYTVMYIPLLIYLFLKLYDKPNIRNLALYIIVQSLQLRARHYQIMYYTIFLMLFLGIYKIIDSAILKKKQVRSILFIAIGLIIVLGAVFQPFYLTAEYTPHSIRGGTGEANSTGLSRGYATSWSFHPKEMITFLIPRYFGGTSSEIYNISNGKYPHLAGRQVPGYWGDMPFTQGSEYIGVVVVLLALFGIITSFRSRLTKTLVLFSIFSLFLSFGRHFPLVYDIFFNYFPGFNKFRVPAMIITMVDITMIIFAGIGFHNLFAKAKNECVKPFLLSSLALLAIGGLALLAATKLSFVKAGDVNSYETNVLNMIIEIRKEFLYADIARMFILLFLTFLFPFLYLKSYIKGKNSVIVFLFLIVLFDIGQIHKRYLFHKAGGNYTRLSKQLKNKVYDFSPTPRDEFILSQRNEKLDFAEFRIYPLYSDFWSNNSYSVFHQSIGGYSPAKLRITQDIVDFGRGENSLLAQNITSMLAAKYFIADFVLPKEMSVDYLKLVFSKDNKFVYENLNYKGRGWFVGEYEIAQTREKRFELLKNPNFNIFEKAILEESLNSPIKPPQNSSVLLTKLDPHNIEFDVFNDVQSLFVISETFYPKGWTAYVNDKPTKIFKTNHVLRGIVVPSGKSKIELHFDPVSIRNTHNVSLAFTLLSYLLLIIGFFETSIRKYIRKYIRQKLDVKKVPLPSD